MQIEDGVLENFIVLQVFRKLMFQIQHIGYWKDYLTLQPRIKFQKHKLKNILEKFDEKLSEAQNMANNGYNRIFDCGNLVFVKILKQ